MLPTVLGSCATSAKLAGGPSAIQGTRRLPNERPAEPCSESRIYCWVTWILPGNFGLLASGKLPPRLITAAWMAATEAPRGASSRYAL